MSRIGFQHSEMAKEKCRIANLGMHSSPATEFWRGHVPWNRGKKGTHFSFATEFKKGQRSTNWKPVGTITVRRDKGSGTLRRWIKIKNPNCWQEYAKYLWLKSGRKLKKGFILGHKDGDSTNDSLGNLILTTRNKYVSMCNRWNTKNTFHSKEEWQAVRRPK